MPDKDSAEAWLEMRRAFDDMDSPEAIENAQREQCRAFCDLFGQEEMTVSSTELRPTLQKFQSYLLTERRDPETGMTAAEVFREEFGRELSVPEMPPLPEPFESAGEVTILCDDFDGIVLLPDYRKFCQIFQSGNPDKEVPEWRDLVWKYIKDPDIPIVAFERVAEQFPARVEAVIGSALDDKEFNLEHLYAVLLHYKEPVEGVDLETDEMLWDLFDGNNAQNDKPSNNKTKGVAKARASATKKTRTPKKPAAKKAAAKKSAAKPVAKTKPAAKARARSKPKASAKKAQSPKRALSKKR
jgi:hypothetical protein